MRVLIENYRGWDIDFDTEIEEFYALSNDYDKDINKKSFAATKKFIDDYIKDNQEFKPIKIQSINSTFDDCRFYTLIGVRKDGDFIYLDENGKKSRFPKYNEKQYFKVDSANDEVFKKLESLENERVEIIKKIQEEQKKLVKFTVDDIRKQLLP